MKRYLSAVFVLAIMGAGCGSSGTVAATVNGTDITVEDINGLVFGDAALADEEFTQLLGIAVQWGIVADAAEEEFGISPTDDEVAEQADLFFAEQGGDMTFEEFLEDRNVSEEGLNKYAAQVVINDRIVEEIETGLDPVTTADAARLLEEDPMAWIEVCSAHILLETLEEAEEVLTLLDEGEDFAALAADRSLDTGSGAAGGDLGCSSPDRYVPEFGLATISAPLGEVTDPVQTQFGFHLIRVDSRSEPSIEELTAAASESNLGAALEAWYRNALESAEVSIAEEWGTWNNDPIPRIVQPGE
ncbi:MAG: peptidylprolyl isomerase [Acidimicrobiia bacterium]|nr:peptidylprolyl isomerase [Acidimicrobiia bacterium]